MALRLPRVGGLGRMVALVGLVGLLLPLLAWLQVDWVSQIAAADAERRTRTLETAASQFAAEMDAELGRLAARLQADGPMVEREDWEAYAQRVDGWREDAAHPALVRDVWLVRAAPTGEEPAPALSLHRWDAAARAFVAADWTGAMASQQPVLAAHAARFAETRGRRERMEALGPLGTDQLIVTPVLRVTVPAVLHVPGPDAPPPPDLRLIGFTAVELDLAALRDDVLPALVQRHFPADGDYRVAIVAADDLSRVIFESEPRAAAMVAAAPDYSLRFPTHRRGPFMFVTRRDVREREAGRGGREARRTGEPPAVPPTAAEREHVEALAGPGSLAPGDGPARDTMISILEGRRGGEARLETRLMAHGEGPWLLRVQHRAGSLEAAVGAARRRNLLLSGSILTLLGAAVVLMALSARRAQQLARQQLEFVAAVSHELRTPVAVINTAAGNLADGVVADPGRVRMYGTTIQAEGRRLAETVERVLQLAGLASGGTLAQTPLAPASLAREAIDACALDVARSGATVALDLPPDLPMVAGDAAALRAALQNLVANALKYGGPAPQVRVRVQHDTGGGRDDVLFVVEDDGLGIAAEDRTHIFEPFYRGREAVARQIQGSGLGLSLVWRIAEAHRGGVTVKSEPGRGSAFTLRLPAVAGSTETAPAGDHAPARSATAH
jgi:signal transduction histidine kinase